MFLFLYVYLFFKDFFFVNNMIGIDIVEGFFLFIICWVNFGNFNFIILFWIKVDG